MNLMPLAIPNLSEVGLGRPYSWLATIGWAVGWTTLMLAYSPVADRLAAKLFPAPPVLNVFRAIQQSTLKLVAGIMIAWLVGAFLRELILRGIVVGYVQSGF